MKTVALILFLSLVCNLISADKHSPKASKIENFEFRNIKSHKFRISKLNILWTKAVHRLTEQKLKSLYIELKIHDKEELALKHLKSENPKELNDGLKEAELRQKLIGIMSKYGLGLLEIMEGKDFNNPEHKQIKEKNGNYKTKALFKDKKLNKLWDRVELSGTFSTEEMGALKEEFQHHEEKVDFYYSLLENLDAKNKKKNDESHKNAVNEDELDEFNEIAIAEDESNQIVQEQKQNKDNQYISKANKVREKHREIKESIDRLERIVSKGSNSSDFIEPKIQGLWRIAQESNFTADQLASIKVELHHFESRYFKLRQMHAEHALSLEKHGDKHYDKINELETKIKKQSRKVEKLQEDLEKRILPHAEL